MEKICEAEFIGISSASVEYRHLFQVRQEIQEMAPPPYTLVEKGKNVTIDHRGGTASIPESIGKGRAEHPTI